MTLPKLSKRLFDNPEPKPQEGALAPLFDRLIDETKERSINPYGRRIYDRDETIDSIIREISNLLNTRLSAKEKEYEEWSQDDLNTGLPQMYGLRDFGELSPSSPKDQFYLRQMCEDAIRRYEPRLKDVKVSVESFDEDDQSLSLVIEGSMKLGIYTEEVTFPLKLQF